VRFTVIVPLYNKAPYVQMALQSVLGQTFADFEVVVVDDGSTDGGAALVDAISDPRLRLVRQANAGVSAARNRGVAQARGQWISFLDADDWLHPEFLARMDRLADAHPGVDIVAASSNEAPHREGWRPLAWPVPADAPVELIRDLPGRWIRPCFNMNTIAFRRELLLGLMPCFVVGMSESEDVDLFFRAAERSPIAYLPVPLACYRTAVADSLMQVAPPSILLAFQARLRERVRRGEVPAHLVRSTLRLANQTEIWAARRELDSGQRRAALATLLRGWRASFRARWWFTLIMVAGAPTRWLVRLRDRLRGGRAA
jgi:glycosyltransferase involved in cell wall biosynthesis